MKSFNLKGSERSLENGIEETREESWAFSLLHVITGFKGFSRLLVVLLRSHLFANFHAFWDTCNIQANWQKHNYPTRCVNISLSTERSWPRLTQVYGLIDM